MKKVGQDNSDARSVYNRMIDVFFYAQPIHDLNDTVTKDFLGYGTAAHEFFRSRADVMQMAQGQSDQLSSQPHKIKRKPIHERLSADGNTCLIVEEFEMTFTDSGHLLLARLSALLERIDEKWVVTHFHGSTPDSNIAEGEAFPEEGLRQKNAELEAKIKERTRELEIESSLERVRSRAMSMQTSEELSDLVITVFKELSRLDMVLTRCLIWIFNPENNDSMAWMANSEDPDVADSYVVPYHDHPAYHSFLDGWKSRDSTWEYTLEGDIKDSWDEILVYGYFESLPEHIKQAMKEPQRVILSGSFNNFGVIQTASLEPLSAASLDILYRFSRVFEQSYTRFLDLQTAEAQTREAQIELALERIRAQVTAMQESAELLDIVVTMRSEFIKLGHEAHYFWHMRWLPEKYQKAMTSGDGTRIGTIMELPRHMHGDIPLLAEWEKSQQPTVVYAMDTEAAIDYVEKMIRLGDFQQIDPQAPSADDMRQIGGLTFVMARTTHGEIGFSLPGKNPNPALDSLESLERFAGVFDLAYRRFEDLKESELQKREAEIELALERVRARTMAMQNSSELKAVIRVIFDQLAGLEINAEHAGIVVDFSPGKDWSFWVAETQDIPSKISVPYLDSLWDRQYTKAKEEEMGFFTTILGFEEKNQFYETLLKHIPGLTKKAQEFYLTCPGLAISTVVEEDIGLYIENFSGAPYTEEENGILKRFGGVFQQTYTRFLDLQKAEAQAQEAQIEAALEKVRSRTMAMQHSDELPEAANVLFLEIQALGIPAWSCGYNILAPDKKSATCWMSSEGSLQQPFKLRLYGEASFDEMGAFVRGDDTFLVQELGGNAIDAHYDHMQSFPDLLPTFEAIKAEGLSLPTYQINHLCKFSQGFLLFITYEPAPEAHDIFKRFTAVFEQTYTRFLDLKNMEAQARESKIETALERVRARALAMQEPKELKDVARVMRQEMGLLGVEELETSSIYIHDPEAGKTECWYAIKDIREAEKVLTADHFSLELKDTWVGREMLKFYASDEDQVSIVMKGAERKEWIDYCEAHSKALESYYGDVVPERTYHLYKFSHGAIGAATPGDLSGESWGLLKRAASVFSLAYSRFRDLTQARIDLQRLKEEKKRAEDALKELQLTQQQLVHAEKMASLGELTAGIAHEIQNPLNFVNNFSDVSRELLEELLEEMEKGDTEEVNAIARDVIQNLEKIVHHGRRADSIVKGMLQHSRSGDGKKEPTDLNALADEYLRLAYHGLRAKDKSFNAKMETDFDKSFHKVEVIPQDIGRVLLNLITNAFHAVKERSQKESQGYEPTVWVGTRKTEKGVEISVRDNGGGIPEEIREKIFQPFFTTKPTGEGTGLGLSMSYDIVTKGHGGQLGLYNCGEEGTEIRIHLPFQTTGQ